MYLPCHLNPIVYSPNRIVSKVLERIHLLNQVKLIIAILIRNLDCKRFCVYLRMTAWVCLCVWVWGSCACVDNVHYCMRTCMQALFCSCVFTQVIDYLYVCMHGWIHMRICLCGRVCVCMHESRLGYAFCLWDWFKRCLKILTYYPSNISNSNLYNQQWHPTSIYYVLHLYMRNYKVNITCLKHNKI